MSHLIYCSTFEGKSGYSIQIFDQFSIVSIKSCVFQLNGIGCGINTLSKNDLLYNTIFNSSNLSDSSIIFCKSSSSSLNFHNYSCFVDCRGKQFALKYDSGIWNVNSINLSRCSAKYSLHVFNKCIECNSSFSIFEMNNVGAITIHFASSNVCDTTRCSIINNTDQGDYHLPGMIYNLIGETTISNFYFYNNYCKWLFMSDRGSLTVEDSYIDQSNNYTIFNTFNAQIKSTVTELVNEIYIRTYSCILSDTDLELQYFSEVVHNISYDVFIIIYT